MKKCRTCDELKDLTQFDKAKSNKDGLNNQCKSCKKQAEVDRYRKDPFVTLARLKKAEGKKKGLPYNLDADYLRGLWTGICPITNETISIGCKGMGSHKSAHLDRFKPELGYIKGNVEYISGRMNRIKYNASVEELKKLIHWMETRRCNDYPVKE